MVGSLSNSKVLGTVDLRKRWLAVKVSPERGTSQIMVKVPKLLVKC